MNKITFDEALDLVNKKIVETMGTIAKYKASGNDVRRNKYEYRLAGLECLSTLISNKQVTSKSDTLASKDVNEGYFNEAFLNNFLRVCGAAPNSQKVVLTPETDVLSLFFDRGWNVSKLIRKCKEQGDVYYDATEKCIKKLPGNLKNN